MNAGKMDNLLVVTDNKKKHPVDVRIVVKIKAEESLTCIHFLNNRVLKVNQGIRQIEEIFKPFHFIKIHKNCLVNPQFLDGLKPGKTAMALLSDDTQEPVSRLYRKTLAEIIEAITENTQI